MNREILFRGKRIDGGWVKGSLLIDMDLEQYNVVGHDYYVGGGGLEREEFCHSVDPDSVGQYTGLIDKNGVRIFEGDIVDYEAFGGERYRGIVKIGSYEQDGSAGEYPPRKCCGAYIERKRWLKQEWQWDEDEEWAMPDYEKTTAVDDSALIIGNIYDNPELLEQNHDQ